MSDFSMFMVGAKDDAIEYVASKKFKDKDGNPIAWKLKPIDSDLDDVIRKESTKKVPIVGKRGQFAQEFDTEKYASRLCSACVVYPNLNDSELQDFYGVKSADALIKKMLLPGEYTELKSKVLEINGYDVSMEDMVDEAKN